MSWFDTVFGGGQGAAANSMAGGYQNSINAYQQYLDQMHGTLNPYMQTGQQAQGNMMNMGNTDMQQFNQMSGAGQPGGWMSAYQESPYAKYLTQQGSQQAMNSAAASGMIGSNQALQGIDQMSQGIASQDRQNYFNNMMQLQQGANSNFQPNAQMGYGAGQQFAQGQYGTGQAIGNAYQNIGMANAYGDTARAGAWDNAINFGAAMI